MTQTAPLSASVAVERAGYALLGALALVIAVSHVPQSEKFNDVLAHSQAVQCAVSGETCFRDYDCPIGPGSLAVVALFRRLHVSMAVAFQLANAVYCAALGGLAFRRLSTCPFFLPRLLAAGFVAFTACDPAPIDVGPWDRLTYAGSYNNLGMALLALLVVEFARAWDDDASPFLFGLLGGFFVTVKVTHAAALPPLLLGLLLLPAGRRPRTWAWLLLGALVALVGVGLLAPYSPVGYFQSSQKMAAVALGSSFEGHRLLWKLRSLLPWILPSALLGTWLVSRSGRRGLALARVATPPLVALLALGLLEGAASSSPAVDAAVFIALAFVAGQGGRFEPASRLQIAGACTAILVLGAGVPASEGLQLFTWNLRHRGVGSEPTVLGFRFVRPPDYSSAQAWVLHPNNVAAPEDNYGFALAYEEVPALVQAHVRPTEILLTDDFSSLAVADGLARGPHGDNVAWHWGRNVDQRQTGLLSDMLQGSDWLLLWRSPYDLIAPKHALLVALSQGRFTEVDRSAHWVLLRRSTAIK